MEALKTQLYPLMLQIKDAELKHLSIELYNSISSDLDEANYVMSSTTEEIFDKFNSRLTKMNSPVEEEVHDTESDDEDSGFEFPDEDENETEVEPESENELS